MSIIILGGGLAGLSLAHFLKDSPIILEKESQLGGLCRSFEFNGVFHDIGPHILFSKNQATLQKILSIINTNQIKRSNKIFYKNRFIKYPFENDLAALSADDKDYCINEFLNNPYETSEAKTMLQFFLKTFGEGITKLYLQPYNEKIWKFDPALMDTQMVERIPKPPKEDIINSAKGIETEGYLHQLYFYYPERGGIQQLIECYKKLISAKSKIINPVQIKKIYKENENWKILTDKEEFICKTLINCMPLHELFNYIDAPEDVLNALNDLKYNSIYIMLIQCRKENLKQNFAVYFADKNVLFHRLSKLNFLGENYCPPDGSSLIMAEITYRTDSPLGSMSEEEIKERVIDNLEELKLVNKEDIINTNLKSFKYAYVIYDLNHRKNTDYVLNYLSSMGVRCCGRFAEFEYLNMDNVIEHSYKLATKLNNERA